MKRIQPLFIIFVFILLTTFVSAQKYIDSVEVIQFSGMVVTEEEGMIVPLPYTNVAIEGTARGTISTTTGFFSLAGLIGEKVVFSHIGYGDVEFMIPDTLTTNMYSIVQIMTKDSILLPEAVIYPWPSREFFDIEFLAMDVSTEMNRRAAENLADRAMALLRENVPADGREAASFEMQQTAASYYYEGQFKPQNIFNAVAWKQFIDAWKRGDFKRKKKKDEEK